MPLVTSIERSFSALPGLARFILLSLSLSLCLSRRRSSRSTASVSSSSPGERRVVRREMGNGGLRVCVGLGNLWETEGNV